MSEPVTQRYATNEDIERILTNMDQIFQGEKPEAILIASLSAAIIVQYPTIELDKLRDGVLHASEAIALFFSALEDEEAGGVGPSQIN